MSTNKGRQINTCKTCNTIKDQKEFYIASNGKSMHHCKKCVLEDRKRNFDATRNARFLRKYGITLEVYNKMYNEQLGKCKICNNSETKKLFGNIINLAVDHCHNTGKVRGLLCFKCNLAIGHLNHNINVLKNAIKYLECEVI